MAEMSAPPPQPEGLDRETLIVAGVVLLGAIMSILDTTVVNVAIDHLAVAFHSPLTTIQWVITGYTLALAAVIPVTGWAADRFGTKRIYMWSLVLFTLGSMLSGLAWSAGSLIFFRVLQGIGGGMIMPAVMTIMTKKAGPHRMGRVMGVLGVPMLVAPILGPILGGWLVDNASWRWIFFINLPIGILAFILALIVLESDQPQPAHRLDWLGMLLLSPGLAAFIFGLAESSTYGFGSVRSWGPTLAGVVLIAAWFIHSWRSPNPLIELRTFAHTRAGAAAGTFFLFAISVFGTMLLVPLYFQAVRGASALQAGLLMAPGGVGAMLLMPLGGRLTDRYGPTWLPAAGLPLVAIGLIPFAFVGPHTSYVVLCAGNFRPGPRNGAGDDAEHDCRHAGGPARCHRPHQHGDEHHPPGRGLYRHRGAVRDSRVSDHDQPQRHPQQPPLRRGVRGARHPAATAGDRARRYRRAIGRCLRLNVRMGARPHPRRSHPRRGHGRLGLASPDDGTRRAAASRRVAAKFSDVASREAAGCSARGLCPAHEAGVRSVGRRR
jgi:EmrB/QacA subfamily drug resistance transporter